MKKIVLSMLSIIILISGAGAADSFNEMVNDLIDRSIPLVNVKQLTLKIRSKKKIYILDARESSEYNVSRIKNAINVGYDDFSLESVKSIPKNAEIIVYCSIGYRSEKVGEELKEAGYSNVFNLFGGIFAWVNDGQPVYDNSGKPTARIHAYNKKWGRWLTRGEKVYD